MFIVKISNTVHTNLHYCQHIYIYDLKSIKLHKTETIDSPETHFAK